MDNQIILLIVFIVKKKKKKDTIKGHKIIGKIKLIKEINELCLIS